MKFGPITSLVYPPQDVAAFFEKGAEIIQKARAARSLTCPECHKILPESAFFREEVEDDDDDHRGHRYRVAAFVECPGCGCSEVEG